MNYNFAINDFEGPLDLLLHLVKSSKMDIYEINIKEIIDQYLEIIHKNEKLNIELASEYLVMAAELIHLKSRILLGYTDEEEKEEYSINSEEDLKAKLVEYEKYKDISTTFKDLEEKRLEVYTKLPSSLNDYKEENTKLNSDLTLQDLLNAFNQFKTRFEASIPLNTKIMRKEISLEERKTSIRNLLKEKKRVDFFELFETFNKEYVIITFLSLLDLSKSQEINIEQEKNFDNIFIEARF